MLAARQLLSHIVQTPLGILPFLALRSEPQHKAVFPSECCGGVAATLRTCGGRSVMETGGLCI